MNPHALTPRRLALALTAGMLTAAALPAQAAGDTHRLITAADAIAAAAQGSGAAPAATATGTLNAAGEGRRLYLKLNCYGCHGMSAAGGMGPNIARAEAGDLREALLQGEDGGMRSYRSYVNSTDIANLAAYLRSIGTADEPKFKDWWVAVPTK